MSDTKKATPRPWQANSPWGNDDPRWTVTQKDGMGFTTLGGKDEKHAKLAEKALNSYNPDRDKLARKLAEMVIAGDGCNLSDCTCGGSLPDYARRLLKLYEEEKP